MPAAPPADDAKARTADRATPAPAHERDVGYGTRSLQARITAAILLTAATVLAIGCVLFMLEQHRTERTANDINNARLLDLVARAQAPRLPSDDAAQQAQGLALLSVYPQIETGVVRDSLGRVRFSYRRAGASSRDATVLTAPVTAGGRRVGDLSLRIAPAPTQVSLGHYLAMGGALFFAAVAVALFLGRWLAARITTPVARLSQAMDAVGESGELRIRVAPDAPDEIGRLTERFNELMARLYVKDVALKRTLDDLVEARDAAEAANLAKSQFLANMSHEIRTPLNGVLAMAQVLERNIDDERRGQVHLIRQSGEALLGLLNDLLDVSKIEAGRLELAEADFALRTVVEDAVEGFSALAQRKRIGLDLQIAPDVCDQRRGDAGRLRQVLVNFLSNALKFTDAGSVTVRVRGEGEDGGEGVRIEVADTGVGIPPEKLDLVFQKFVQVDPSATRRHGGTGLGLAICEELATLMGGRVWVESEPGRGSTFFASLPLARVGAGVVEGEASDVEAPGDEDAQHPPVRVLAAEDNPTNRMVVGAIMQIFGFDVAFAEDGEQAVSMWREGDFDLVLMDIQMPKMDGVSAARAIRAQEAASGRPRTPILALSANALPDQVRSYLAAGMDGHVAKPIEIARLQAALEDALAQDHATGPGAAKAS